MRFKVRGDILKTLRREAGLSQGMLSGKVGVTKNFITMIENGKAGPGPMVAKKIAGVFGKEVLDIFEHVPSGIYDRSVNA